MPKYLMHLYTPSKSRGRFQRFSLRVVVEMCLFFLLKMIYHDQEMVQIYRPFYYDFRVFWLLVEENYPMADFLTQRKINLQPKQFFEVKKDKRSRKKSRELLWCGVYCRDGIRAGQALTKIMSILKNVVCCMSLCDFL